MSHSRGGLRHLSADMHTSAGAPSGWGGFALSLLTIRGLATMLFRLSQDAGHKNAMVGLAVKQVNHLLTGADLAWQAQVGSGLKLYHPTGVVIGPDVVVGERCAIQANVTLGAARQRGQLVGGRVDSPVVGDDVRIGAGAVVLGPINVGSDGIIGANAAVIRDCPAGSLTVGVPASSRPMVCSTPASKGFERE